jgi:hypothetical protein
VARWEAINSRTTSFLVYGRKYPQYGLSTTGIHRFSDR